MQAQRTQKDPSAVRRDGGEQRRHGADETAAAVQNAMGRDEAVGYNPRDGEDPDESGNHTTKEDPDLGFVARWRLRLPRGG